MITIGLTGKYCAGKSHIASLLDLPTIEVDELGVEALEAVKGEVIATFGTSIVQENREIDRKALGRIVFSDPLELAKLEALLHPQMREAVLKRVVEYRKEEQKAIVINAALLKRMHLELFCDYVCYVYAPGILRFLRAKARDKATLSTFLGMERSQKDIDYKYLSQPITLYILKNYGSNHFISRQVAEFCVSIGV